MTSLNNITHFRLLVCMYVAALTVYTIGGAGPQLTIGGAGPQLTIGGAGPQLIDIGRAPAPTVPTPLS